MMNTKKSSARSIWKYLFILPLLAFSMMSLNTIESNDSSPIRIQEDPTEVNTTEEENRITPPVNATEEPTRSTALVTKPKQPKKSKAKKQEENVLNYGLWKGSLKGNNVCFSIDNAGETNRQTRRICL